LIDKSDICIKNQKFLAIGVRDQYSARPSSLSRKNGLSGMWRYFFATFLLQKKLEKSSKKLEQISKTLMMRLPC
jgi:hypothetical protein